MPDAPVAAAERPYVVEWFRHDRSRIVVPTMIIAACMTLVGCALVAIGFAVHRYGTGVERLAITAGILCTAGGPALVVLRLRRVLAEEAYVALRSDGVSVNDGTLETMITWDELAEVRFDAETSALVIERRDAEPVRVTQRFAGIELPALAKRIDALRLKAAFRLLPA